RGGRASDVAAYQPGRLLKDGKVLRGKEGWLFLAADKNDVLGQHTGEVVLDGAQLDHWRRLLEERQAALASLGASFLFVVSPNTPAVYDDKLPDWIRPAPKRPVHQIMEALAQPRNSRAQPRETVKVIYPLEELREARARRAVCCKTDSHWNEFGAFVG